MGSAFRLALGLGDVAPGLAGTLGWFAGLAGCGGPGSDAPDLGAVGLAGGVTGSGMLGGSERLLAAPCGLFGQGDSQGDFRRGRRRNDDNGRVGGGLLWFRHDWNLTRVGELRTPSLVRNQTSKASEAGNGNSPRRGGRHAAGTGGTSSACRRSLAWERVATGKSPRSSLNLDVEIFELTS